nr:unnamed protein product [Callosobruchus analis]
MARKRQTTRRPHRPDRTKRDLRGCETYKTGKITPSAFLNFVRDVRKNAKGLSVCEIGSKAGKMWRNMTDEQKKPYFLMAKKAKLQIPRYRKRQRKRKSKKRRRSTSRKSTNE